MKANCSVFSAIGCPSESGWTTAGAGGEYEAVAIEPDMDPA